MFATSRLLFARSGRVLISWSPEQVLVRHIGEPTAFALELGDELVHDLVAFDDELWVSHAGSITRHHIDNGKLIDRTPVPAIGTLQRCLFDTPAVLWVGPAASQTFALQRGSLAAIGEPQPDALLPVGLTRVLVEQGQHVALRDPSGERWRVALGRRRVLDGNAVFGGTMIALVVGDGWPVEREKQLMLLAGRDGIVQYAARLNRVDAVRFAPLRGVALLRAEGRVLILFDLRFGKILQSFEHAGELTDLAIDDAGQVIAVRSGDELTIVSADQLAQIAPAPVADTSPAVTPLPARAEPDRAAAETAPAPATQPDERPPVRIVAPAALLPRPQRAVRSRVEVTRWLDQQRQLVVAIVVRAIAHAWDTGRLAFPNESSLAFESEVLGVLGKGRDRAQVQMRVAENELERAVAQAEIGERARAGQPVPLDELGEELGLSRLDRHLLLLVAAPQIWGEVARLYAILANDEQRRTCDEALLCELVGGAQRYEIAVSLSRDSALVGSGAIRVGGDAPRPFARLSVDEVIIHRLRGDRVGVEMDATTRHVPATRELDELIVPRPILEYLGRELAVVNDRPLRLVVRGRLGSGRRTLLATLARSANRELGIIDAEGWLRDPRTSANRLLVALQQVALRGWLPCIENLDAIENAERSITGGLREVIRAYPGPLALRLGWDVQPPLDPGYLLVDLPPTNELARVATWNRVLAREHRTAATIDEIASRYRVGPGTIERVASHVVERSAPGADVSAALEDALRQFHERRLGVIATRVTRLATWASIVLPNDIVDSLLEMVARVRHRRRVYEAWGFDRVLSTARGLTALFQGSPGTGKTMVAGAIANELGLDLYRVDLSRVMSKWIGETERNLAAVFDAAEDSQAVILFDEADSLFSKRTEVRTSVDRYANLEVNYLLQRLDSFEGIAILTTNFGTAIDQAFKRRLSFRLTFPFPDEEAREQLWRAHIPAELPIADRLDLGTLARRYQLSGGYIRNAAVRAAFLAALEESPLRQEHLERAVKLEYREMGKLGEGGQLE
jgi:hypothetical protein